MNNINKKTMKLSIYFKLFIPLIPLVFAACTPHYYFNVDAINDGEINTNGSFYLVSSDPELKENSLRFRESAGFIATALEGKGYHRANDLRSADYLIEIAFEIGEPRESVDVRYESYTHWTPGRSFAVSVPVYNNAGQIVGHQQRIVTRPPRSHTHWDEYLDSTTVFEKTLSISAYDNRLRQSSEEAQQVWSVTVTNEDRSEDLRSYIPIMVAVALPYMGEDTGRSIRTSINEDDENLAFIRNPNN